MTSHTKEEIKEMQEGVTLPIIIADIPKDLSSNKDRVYICPNLDFSQFNKEQLESIQTGYLVSNEERKIDCPKHEIQNLVEKYSSYGVRTFYCELCWLEVFKTNVDDIKYDGCGVYGCEVVHD